MNITVAVCTWNRERLLLQTLRSLEAVSIPSGVGVQVLVVDNASTDGTARALKEYKGGLNLTTVFEQEPGISSARNAAIAASSGEYIIWLDDDVLVDGALVRAYVDAFRKYGEATFFGGPILPHFETPPARWLASAWVHVASAFSIRDFGERPFEFVPGMLRQDKLPYGANMATRTDVVRTYLFDTAVSHRHGTFAGGDEIGLFARMFDNGYTGWYVPGAVVWHWLPPERMTLDFLSKRSASAGLQIAHNLEPGGRSAFGAPLWLWRELLEHYSTYVSTRALMPSTAWLPAFCRYHLTRGIVTEVRNRTRAAGQ
jgi:glucosyl-dolichyl phosphate glucuronosyltransferase